MTVTVKSEHVYEEPVELVAATHLTKYPNEYDPCVISCNVVERKRDGDGCAYTRRIAAVKNVLPSMLRRIPSLQAEQFELEEECLWDCKARKMDVESRNLSATEWVTLRETSHYSPHQQNPNWTQFEQEGTITVHGLGALSPIIEMFSKRFLSAGAQRSIGITERLMAERCKRIQSFWYSEFLFA